MIKPGVSDACESERTRVFHFFGKHRLVYRILLFLLPEVLPVIIPVPTVPCSLACSCLARKKRAQVPPAGIIKQKQAALPKKDFKVFPIEGLLSEPDKALSLVRSAAKLVDAAFFFL